MCFKIQKKKVVFGIEICNVSYDKKKNNDIRDVMGNTNVKEGVVEGK